MIHQRVYLLSIFLAFIFTNLVFSQRDNCDCKADLAFLDAKIKKTTTSYKNNKNAYNASLARISILAEKTTSIYDCYVLLNTLMLSLNDNHSRIYGTDNGATKEVKSDSIKYAAFKNAPIYNLYPILKIDLDSLESVLNSKAVADVEGVYSLKDYITIGFFKDEASAQFKTVVLDSKTDLWKRGELVSTAIPFGNKYLSMMSGSYTTKKLEAYTERVDNGMFHFMGLTKNQNIIRYPTAISKDSIFFREELTPEITYIRLGSFNSWYPTLREAENFYKQLNGTLTKPNLIVDLRNNGGGGDRNSDIVYKLLKTYSKKNKIYVLINHRTGSNAEQFAYKLSKLNNCEIYGQYTNGVVGYEIKNGFYDLPSGHFIAVLTSKTCTAYVDLESKGVQPDFELSLDSDWIEQTIKLIQEKSKD